MFCQDITKTLQELSHFVQAKKTNLQWVPYTNWMRDIPCLHFDHSLTEDLQNTAKYVILLGIQLAHNTTDASDTLHPVIKKNGDYYKSVGLCNIWISQHLLTNDYKRCFPHNLVNIMHQFSLRHITKIVIMVTRIINKKPPQLPFSFHNEEYIYTYII